MPSDTAPSTESAASTRPWPPRASPSPGTFHQAEAKSRFCPIATQRGTAFLRANPYCLGPPCALWRWDLLDQPGALTYSTTHGYCGLGGRP